jgi:Pathogenicity locus
MFSSGCVHYNASRAYLYAFIIASLKKMKNRQDITNFNDIPNVGPATIRYLKSLEINTPFELIGQDPYSMYHRLCKETGKQFDPCLADVFISAVKFMEGAPPRKWWYYTKYRKEIL